VNTTNHTTRQDYVATYLAKGWFPVPIDPRKKGPTLPGWQRLRITPPEIKDYFNGHGNVGLILGDPSGGLTDGDLDCPEARKAAAVFLPPTPMVSGRAGNPQSHLWYISTPPPRLLTFKDPLRPKDEAMIIELRANPKSEDAEGLQTVVPPSLHKETGELIYWENPDNLNPVHVPAQQLIEGVTYSAVCTLLGRYWTDHGGHGKDMVMAIAGALLRSRLNLTLVRKIVLMSAAIAGYPRAKSTDVDDTATNLARNKPVTGWPKLHELLDSTTDGRGGKIIRCLQEWLGEGETGTSAHPAQSAVTVGKVTAKDEEPPADIPDFPSLILEGTYIGELALALTAGTALAPQLAYSNIKACLGTVLDRRVGFPGHEDIHLRHYTLNVTHRPRQGKGETWKRVQSALGLLLEQYNVQIEDGSRFGSGQFMVKKLSEMEKTRQGTLDLLVSFDEMRDFFQKADIRASTLISVFCTLFEKHSIKQGSFDHGDHAVEDTHLSFIGDFTAAMFQQCLAGRGAAGQGFLPRCALAYGRWKPAGDWTPRNIEREQGIVDKIRHALDRLPEGVFVPKEEEDARECRLDFFAGIEKQMEQGDYFPLEIQSYFKRDLLLRTVFSDDPVITLAQTARSIAWANHQLNVRRTLWPEDIGSQTEQMERKLQRLARERGSMSDRDFRRYAHVDSPGCGGFEVYNRAMLNLRRAGVFVIVGKTRKKNPIWWFAPDDD
jgi:hypothetical protein